MSKENYNVNEHASVDEETGESTTGHNEKKEYGANLGIDLDSSDEQDYLEDYDEKEFKRLLRKIDFRLLPLVCVLYAVQFMDKTSTSYAAIMGLRTYFDMQGNMYSWAGSSFYLGYLVFAFPLSMLLQRFPVAKTMSLMVVIWGVLLCLHSAASNYASFITLRTLLGVFESAVTPAMVIITSQWYKKEEHFLRTSFWFAFNGLGTIMGGGIAYGLASRDGSYTLPAWKVLFIVIGVITIFLGILMFIWVPDVPSKAIWLSERERKLTVLRIKTNQQGFGNKHFKLYQFKEALLDVNTWLFFAFAVASNIPNGSLTNFGTILLQESLNYTAKESLLMNMPTGAVELVGCILLGYLYGYFPHRLLISFGAMLLSLACSCMLAFAKDHPKVRLAGYYLMFVYPLTMICNLSCFSSNVTGHTKKITVNAIYLIGYCVGNLVGPQTFIASQAPNYVGGETAIVVCYSVSSLLILWIYWNYYSANAKRDKLQIPEASTTADIDNIQFSDLTDKENLHFRYSL